MSAPAWLDDCVTSGIQRLLVLRLKNSPAHDTVVALVDVWLEALTANHRDWVEARDVPRVHAAFMHLLAQVDTWPAPAQLIRALPPLPLHASLPAPAVRNDPEHIARCRKRIAAALNGHKLFDTTLLHTFNIGAEPNE